MSQSSWRIEDPHPDDAAAADQQAPLVSMHFLRAALRRRWRTWVGLALVGLLLGVAWTVVLPAKSIGTVTVLLTHDPGIDPNLAMATDQSLLGRTVAKDVIDRLGLQTTPEDLLQTITTTPASTRVLVLDISAPNRTAAVTRAKTLADSYLAFRNSQIQRQSQTLVTGYRKRVAKMQEESSLLSEEYNTLSTGGPAARSRAADVLSERSQVNSDIGSLQQIIQDTALNSASIVAASYVLDPASTVHYSAKKRLVLAMGSGLVGGLAVGMGLVLFTALTSDRLRRREEVALALGAPVRSSVEHLRHRPWPPRIRPGSSSGRDLQVLVHGLGTAVSPRTGRQRKGRAERLALASVDNPAVAELVVASMGAQLTVHGYAVFLVDLSEGGRLERALKRALEREGDPADPSAVPVVFRPEGVPSLARGPAGAAPGAGDLPKNDPRRPAFDEADVVLTLADVDPAVGADHLRSWADQVVLLVTAGRSSAERLRTTGELVRSSGLRLPFALMVGADETDESLGLLDTPDDDLPGARRTS